MSSVGSTVLPPLETGSFIAGHSDESQFIGSASGVFFANTVLRAFSKTSAFSWIDGAPEAPDANSVHERLVGLDGPQIPVLLDGCFAGQSARASEEEPGAWRPSYGAHVPDLGRPPVAAEANHLMFLYFTHWHPFFPFLHGPSFIPEMEKFYNSPDRGSILSQQNLREKLCRAVTFQCVFMVAGSMHDLPEPVSRIRSTSALLNLVGHLSTHHDTLSLRALLAMEIYMISTSSLRAASTVNGILTRLMYHAGYHRCPHRYAQLTRQARITRKRMFWCAYVVDRYLSQALGLPLGFHDQDIDVCIPEMVERHRTPTQPHGMSAPASSQTDTPTAAPLPGHLDFPTCLDGCEVETMGSGSSECPRRAGTPGGVDAQGIGKHVLGYLVTYSRLAGRALDLFHQSVHVRAVSRERVQDVTYEVHAWWNDLPAPFQVFEHSPSAPPYGGLFMMLRHNLLLLIHRPFLSLPTQRVEFKLSMQVLVDACRNVAKHFPRCTQTIFLTAWPVTLSTIWMTGLVVSYATLLGLYSLHKASTDIGLCLEALAVLARRWPSALHCQGVLKRLLQALESGSREAQWAQRQSEMSAVPERGYSYRGESLARPVDLVTAEQPSPKRQKKETNNSADSYDVRANPSHTEPVAFQDMIPVLQYTGPDFGFDATSFNNFMGSHDALDGSYTNELGGFYTDADWEAYTQGLGGFLGE